MPHISFSELKYWNQCPFYHKLVYLDKIKGFEGNAFTAFGTAVHDTCEQMVLKEGRNFDRDKYFAEQFDKQLGELKEDPDQTLVEDMKVQVAKILPEVLPALNQYFGKYKVISTEEKIYEPIEEFAAEEYKFKGFIDLVLQTEDGKYHVIDWKTCSWGWDSRRKSEPMTTYQLTLYKYYFAQKHNIPPSDVETHFALLKRTGKQNIVEIFRVTSGKQKTQNAKELLKKALYNIEKSNYIKNKLACRRCEFYKTIHCP